MILDSVLFLFRFLPIFLICYFVVPQRMKNLILFFGNLFFCAWGNPIYLVVLMGSAVCEFFHGHMICRNREKPLGKWFLASSIALNVAIFVVFRYVTLLGGEGEMPFPIGISVFTLENIAYSIDVYAGRCKGKRPFQTYMVYITMFLSLSAGIVVNYREMADKLATKKVTLEKVSNGFKRIVKGLAKKLLLADYLGMLWAQISVMDYQEMSALSAWMGIIAYGLYIYYTLSGYADMAIGIGQCLGFELPENFSYPYVANTVTEFWRRWHKTLGIWFKEYVYIPLGGSRKGLIKQIFAIMVVWMMVGAWYGAGIHYIYWGLWFALFLIIEKAFLKKIMTALPRVVGVFYMGIVVMIGWVFFAVNPVEKVGDFIRAMFLQGRGSWYDREALYLLLQYMVVMFIAIVLCTPLIERMTNRLKARETGLSIMIYRLLEKIVPVILLILSVACLTSRGEIVFPGLLKGF